MSELDRRQLFSAAMAAAGLGTATTWCRRWFETQGPADAERERELRDAATKARAQGKPLLVFVVPDSVATDANEAYLRSRWISALLNHGGESALLDVATCVPACATLPEVRRVTGAAAIEGRPLMLLVDVGDRATNQHGEVPPPPKVTRLDLDLAPLFPEPRGKALREDVEGTKRHIEAGVARLAASLHETLRRHGSTLTNMADAVVARLDAEQRKALTAWWVDGKPAQDDLIVRATADLRRRLESELEAARADKQKRLLAAIENELVRRRVPGGRWHRDSGCGSSPEEPTAGAQDRSIVACGMGMVPAYCERFLWFYTDL
ncbi:MAG: hypothetical protein R3F56_21385 [Planctomycetota bacterium]